MPHNVLGIDQHMLPKKKTRKEKYTNSQCALQKKPKFFIFFSKKVKITGEAGLWHENWQFLPNELKK